MRFNREVVRFDFAGIPMVGNLDSGYAIGLTDDGARVCDTLLVEDVEKCDIAAVDEHLLQHLDFAGFFGSSQQDNGLKSAYLHVTQRCNLDCLACYSFDDQRNTAKDVSLESFEHALNELARAGISNLVISGGEPFLREDLSSIIAYAKQDCGIACVSVLSNGTCLDMEQLTQMAPYVDRVAISFDGCSPHSIAYIRQEQRFTELLGAVKTIQDVGIPSHIIATIHAKNVDDIVQYNELAERLGVTLSLSLLSCAAGSDGLGALAPGEKELRALGRKLLELGEEGRFEVLDSPIGLNLTVKRNCGAGKKTISVGADGTVYPCHIMHTPELGMGNLFEGSIEEVIHSDVSMALETLDVRNFDDCKSCDYMLICGGGCRGRSLTSLGDLTSKDGYCPMITEFYGGLGKRLKEVYSSQRRG